tara:strand:+ start:252 stop:551 length:300 start_codon:yes stop_codon:yes gene_type:complete
MSVDIQLDEKIKIKYKEPKNYKVVMLNDDYTPMDFVINMLMDYFKHTEETALFLTNQIHDEGSGIAGIYSYEIAEMKALEVTKQAQNNGFPLQLKLEEE